jgi:spore maturation protein CgeB
MHIDAYSSAAHRAKTSDLFDLSLVFHPLYLNEYEATGHPGVRAFPHAIPSEQYRKTFESGRYDVAMVGRLDGPDYAYRRAVVDRLRTLRVSTNDMDRYHPYEEMIETYARSRITVNVGRGDHLQEAHLSCLEIMGAGTLLLTTRDPDTDRPHELEELGFSEDKHFATFADLNELGHKINYYLDHQDERELMATRARDYTLQKHTYDRRADTLLTWIERGIPRRAPARNMTEAEVEGLYINYFSKRGKIDESLRHLRHQRKAGGSPSDLLLSIGKTAKATVRGWQRALFS